MACDTTSKIYHIFYAPKNQNSIDYLGLVTVAEESAVSVDTLEKLMAKVMEADQRSAAASSQWCF